MFCVRRSTTPSRSKSISKVTMAFVSLPLLSFLLVLFGRGRCQYPLQGKTGKMTRPVLLTFVKRHLTSYSISNMLNVQLGNYSTAWCHNYQKARLRRFLIIKKLFCLAQCRRRSHAYAEYVARLCNVYLEKSLVAVRLSYVASRQPTFRRHNEYIMRKRVVWEYVLLSMGASSMMTVQLPDIAVH